MMGNRWAVFRNGLAPVMLLAVCCGCGSSGSKMAAVHGVVTYQQNPLPDADVMFIPRAGGRPATGRTDAQGRFDLTTSRNKDGALVGEHDVIVTKLDRPPGMPLSDAPAASAIVPATPPARKSLIPIRYGDAKASGLHADVATGDNAFQFDLANTDPR